MLDSILFRLKNTHLYIILLGVVLIFIEGYLLYGFGLVIFGILFYLLIYKLVEKRRKKVTYEADENGNIKPNYH